ncbi:hypothetical protein GGR54DRAFT_615697 [Hypoxylon sp. NC1633]|nr:hypothetical protein GGR54DRAFT_615697 [Hypoxylon sp. NC1633]
MAQRPTGDSGRPALGVQAMAVATGAFLTGAMGCVSAVFVPVLIDTNTDASHLLRQWARTFYYGHLILPTICVGACGVYAYSALTKRAAGSKHWSRYAAAGITTITMVPYTWLVMASTNNTLFSLLSSVESSSGVGVDLELVQGLVVRWAWLHVVRTVFPLLGTIVGFRGILKEVGL